MRTLREKILSYRFKHQYPFVRYSYINHKPHKAWALDMWGIKKTIQCLTVFTYEVFVHKDIGKKINLNKNFKKFN